MEACIAAVNLPLCERRDSLRRLQESFLSCRRLFGVSSACLHHKTQPPCDGFTEIRGKNCNTCDVSRPAGPRRKVFPSGVGVVSVGSRTVLKRIPRRFFRLSRAEWRDAGRGGKSTRFGTSRASSMWLAVILPPSRTGEGERVSDGRMTAQRSYWPGDDRKA